MQPNIVLHLPPPPHAGAPLRSVSRPPRCCNGASTSACGARLARGTSPSCGPVDGELRTGQSVLPRSRSANSARCGRSLAVGRFLARRAPLLSAGAFDTSRTGSISGSVDNGDGGGGTSPSVARHEVGKAGRRRRAAFDDEYLIGLVWGQRRQLAVGMVCLLLCTASNLAAPVLSGLLMETLVKQQPLEQYAKILGILAVGYVLEPILSRVYMQSVINAGEKVLATVRLELFRTLLMQKISYYDKHNASDLTGLISLELDTVRSFVFNNMSRDRGPRAVLEAVGAVVVLFFLSWRLAPICSIVIVATGLAAAIYRRHTKHIEQAQGSALARMTAVALQALENMKTVRSFGGESLERERFQQHVASSYDAGVCFASAKSLFEASNRGAIHMSLLALYAWGGWLVAHGYMPLSVLVSGIGFTFSLMYATQGIVNTLTELRRASGALNRVRSMVNASEPDPNLFSALPPGAWWDVANGDVLPPAALLTAEDAGDAALEAARRGTPLELRGVTFSYPSRPDAVVLQDLTLTLPRGKVTAVVGRSGAGKTTIANLLARFYQPQAGGVFIDDRPVEEFTIGEWSRAVAMVGQEPVLFSGTIADNIAYGRWGHAGADEVRAAAEAANAHEFIVKLPNGYDTVVGERGALLSGGQRQRVALARALLKDSPVIILDEATSALDSVSERLVQQAVQRLVEGRTVVVIAHRLSTVQNADQIVVMCNGRVADIGTHAELSEKSNEYNELMNPQDLILSST